MEILQRLWISVARIFISTESSSAWTKWRKITDDNFKLVSSNDFFIDGASFLSVHIANKEIERFIHQKR